MNNQSRITYKRSLAALGASAALALALTGCLPGGAPVEPVAASTAAQKDSPAPQESEASQERGGDDDASPTAKETAKKTAKETDKKADEESAAPAPADTRELTAPGTKLKFGEVAYTHSNSGDKDTDEYKEATYETKVTKIVAGSEADLAEFKDAAKFAGQTPYYVFTDVTLTSLSRPSAGIGDPRITAQLKDGSDAQKLIVFGSIGDCEDGTFETEGEDDDFSYVVGSSKSMCSVFLAPAGDEITAASYDDSNFSYDSYNDNEYYDAPIVWSD
ncbi:hypothetical protein ACT3TS_00350 [Specibacter sp. AOP5-B1-6]|uniref:hypothetical protein n=1 Tax=Specibacter sp. AOP5-B1-6 TaxID=3457653 RepID=UPI00402BF1F0